MTPTESFLPKMKYASSNTLPEALMYQNFRDYDVTRNADRFVIIVPEQKDTKAKTPPDAPRINVVLNWIEELKQRVPAP